MQNDEAEIRQLVATWMSATRAGNVQTVLSLMAEDVVFLMAGRPPMVGREACAEASKGQARAERPTFEGTSEIQRMVIAREILGKVPSRR